MTSSLYNLFLAVGQYTLMAQKTVPSRGPTDVGWKQGFGFWEGFRARFTEPTKTLTLKPQTLNPAVENCRLEALGFVLSICYLVGVGFRSMWVILTPYPEH